MNAAKRYDRIVQNALLAQYARPKRCALADEWREWSQQKQDDRLFMSCPACGRYGSHVGSTRAAKRIAQLAREGR